MWRIPDEWLGRVHHEDVERVRGEVSAHLDGTTPNFQSEHRLLDKSENYRSVLVRGLAYRDASGKAVRFAGTCADVTERSCRSTPWRASRRGSDRDS